MKKLKLFLLPLFLFTIILIDNSLTAQQYYCFFVANYSEETFSSIRIRETGTNSFGSDLLPDMWIEPNHNYVIRTGNATSSIYDVEIKEFDGTPLKFKWLAENGNEYTKSYITLDLSPLNTLVITTNEDGTVSWDITNEDDYGLGNPCDEF